MCFFLLRKTSLTLIGIALTLIIYLSGVGVRLEESVGLDLLFTWRGKIQAPSCVAVIAIDRQTSKELNFPEKLTQWPRSIHAELITKLKQAGAKVIAFDLFFKESRGNDDLRLASAISNAGNVVLFSHLKRESNKTKSDLHLNFEQLLLPTPILAQSARATANFALPDVPARVDYFWSFRPSAGDQPTVPIIALQLAALETYPHFLKYLKQLDAESIKVLPTLDELYANNLQNATDQIRGWANTRPNLFKALVRLSQADSVSELQRVQLNNLLEVYFSSNLYYLNFYGPARSVDTIPYQAVIAESDPKKLNLTGRTVFIGLSEITQPDQLEGFPTVFTSEDGLDLSGVEIAATAYANLHDRSFLRFPPAWLLAIGMTGFFLLVAYVSINVKAVLAILTAFMISAFYAYVSYYLFASFQLWLPFVVPLFVTTPLIIFIAQITRYLIADRERLRVRQAFSLHVPEKLVEQAARGESSPEIGDSVQWGVCLHCDLKDYTGLAETQNVSDLGHLMRQYYETIIQPIHKHQGRVADLAGDGLCAIWSSSLSHTAQINAAALAALDIVMVVAKLNKQIGTEQFHPRIGLHAGEITLGIVGGHGHREFRAFGDTVNTASRLQSLNRKLGTQILASRTVVSELEGVRFTQLGSFVLCGKNQSIDVVAVSDSEREVSSDAQILEQGVKYLQARMWQSAQQVFCSLQEKFPNRAILNFYLDQCRLLAMGDLGGLSAEGAFIVGEK